MTRSGASRRLDTQPSVLDGSDAYVLAEQLRCVAATVPPDLPHRRLDGQVCVPQQSGEFFGSDHRQERQRRLPIGVGEHPYELRDGHVNLDRQGTQSPVGLW